MSQQRITAAPVRKTIHVNAPQARAFEVFTARFGSWWPKGHHIAAVEMKEAVIEPRRGGRWYEKGIDGSECQWGEVLVWEPPSKVVLSWRLNSKFQIDETIESEVEVRFIADGANATRVELEHRITSTDAEAIRAGVDSPQGWGGLLALYAEVAQK
ncbi:MAG: SRPBCC family protein [Alphaproteobacteria bacterium]|nr:SRPBCC family protein [Alphaproteobacteria bacterium]MDE1986033.1 SRPBCC family protein [Alphaproteobacteria bacterium]MDE2164046.1 SRPBCC family protein [Alphaproteobacteria bacterium]MDE2266746.1 SRPBCC family protein [Alphaproteobacteria bacterium]MDE2499636.1 SRPBCC family protein [Alphaproteobacteria bacterium]